MQGTTLLGCMHGEEVVCVPWCGDWEEREGKIGVPQGEVLRVGIRDGVGRIATAMVCFD